MGSGGKRKGCHGSAWKPPKLCHPSRQTQDPRTFYPLQEHIDASGGVVGKVEHQGACQEDVSVRVGQDAHAHAALLWVPDHALESGRQRFELRGQARLGHGTMSQQSVILN